VKIYASDLGSARATSNHRDVAERRLKRLIADSPSLLPGVDERRTAVATEVRMPRAGSADVVVV
jgi:hypothetical protein